MSITVSVIIPAYNAEKYIKKCLSSLQSQTFKDFEVIVVNDGSTDKTSDIIDSFTSDDSRFKRIDQSNAGASEARNKGLDAAKGKYITFVDSDDYVSENHLQVLISGMDNSELSVCGYITEYPDGQEKEKVNVGNGNFDKIKILNRVLISENAIGGYLWNKMYLADIIRENTLKFPTGEKYMFEDVFFNYQYIKLINNANCNSEYTYHYVHHFSDGMSRGLDNLDSKWLHYVDILDRILEENDTEYNEFLHQVRMAKVWHCATAVRVLGHFGKNKSAEYCRMKKYIRQQLPEYLRYDILPLKKRLGGLLTYLTPKLSFIIWNSNRA